jgi:hypothetical protein
VASWPIDAGDRIQEIPRPAPFSIVREWLRKRLLIVQAADLIS